MTRHPPYGPIFLMPGQAIRIPDAGSFMLRVRSGTVWMTQAGRLEDHIIGPDESRCFSPAADVVVSAFAPARLELIENRAGCPEAMASRRAPGHAGQPVPA